MGKPRVVYATLRTAKTTRTVTIWLHFKRKALRSSSVWVAKQTVGLLLDLMTNPKWYVYIVCTHALCRNHSCACMLFFLHGRCRDGLFKNCCTTRRKWHTKPHFHTGDATVDATVFFNFHYPFKKTILCGSRLNSLRAHHFSKWLAHHFPKWLAHHFPKWLATYSLIMLCQITANSKMFYWNLQILIPKIGSPLYISKPYILSFCI